MSSTATARTDLIPVEVTGPHGRPVRAEIGIAGTTAFVETAALNGDGDAPDPAHATSRGVGELITAALNRDVERVVVGADESTACDGGLGALRALGLRVQDASGALLEDTADLGRARRLDDGHLDPRLSEVDLVVEVDPEAVLCGPRGTARTSGSEHVEQLAAGMQIWADLLRRHSGTRLTDLPGGGTSGGLAAGFAAVLGARLAAA
ncbi:glycerate kinase [Saccharopolyspora rosea]|uniref:Glycerate kinase n=1 Tax=Saccharopolyspora rosea TaxID=524884 RepID=A0ABW3FUK8_9PSEU|nr:glycerate kinase [Saccharopolyspora rosea]